MTSQSDTNASTRLYVVVVKDFKDDQALSRRLESRGVHFDEARKRHKDGILVRGGAILNSHEDKKMIGSTLVIKASSEQQVMDYLKTDPYSLSKTWDLDSVEIYPYIEADLEYH